MKPIITPFTKLFDLKFPLVSAPMAGIEGLIDLAIATSTAGGLGFYQASTAVVTDSPEKIKSTFSTIRQRLQIAETSRVPVGIAFLAWVIEKQASPRDVVQAALEAHPTAIWFAFGNQLSTHIQQVREYDAKHSTKTPIFVTVNTVDEARVATEDWKVDVIVVQGYEAGGHGSSLSPPISIFVQSVLSSIPNAPPILAAGGIATGAQIASLLTLGCAGVVLGTRLLFTEELASHAPGRTSVLLDAGHTLSVRSMAFDEVRRTLGWPKNIDGRGIANGIIQDVREGVGLEERIKRYDEGVKNKDANRTVVWAGQAVGLTNEVRPAKEIITSLHEETVRALENARGLLG